MTFKESIKELLENLVNSTLTEKVKWQVSKYSNSMLEVKVDDFLFVEVQIKKTMFLSTPFLCYYYYCHRFYY